jgi:hypothetical protein
MTSHYKLLFGFTLLFYACVNSMFCQKFDNNQQISPEFIDTLDRENPKAGSKSYDPKAEAEALQKRFSESVKNSEDKNEWATIHFYDPVKLNFARFKNSPCYDEIGFHPMNLKSEEDVKYLEKFYEKCEAKKHTQLLIKVLFAVIFISIIVVVIYYSTKRK